MYFLIKHIIQYSNNYNIIYNMIKAVPHRGTAFIRYLSFIRIPLAKTCAALKSSSFGCTAACL